MKKTIAILLLILLTITTVSAGNVSGYIGVSTGYEFNIMNMSKTKIDSTESAKMNFQGVPFYLEGETYFCPWVGVYYGVGLITFPTVLKNGDVSLKPFADDAPTLFTSPYLGLALRYDFNDMLAMILDTGLSYMAWKLPIDASSADYVHMLNIKADLALGIHPMNNMSVRIGLKVDTPVYAGFRFAEETGIRLGNTKATAHGVKLVPYIGLGYAYGRAN